MIKRRMTKAKKRNQAAINQNFTSQSGAPLTRAKCALLMAQNGFGAKNDISRKACSMDFTCPTYATIIHNGLKRGKRRKSHGKINTVRKRSQHQILAVMPAS